MELPDHQPESPAATTRRSYAILAGLLLTILALDVLFLPRLLWASDALISRGEAQSLYEHGRLWIDPQIVSATDPEMGRSYDLNSADGHWYSKYGVGNSLLSLPPMIAEITITGQYASGSAADKVILNIWNILLSLLLAWALFIITGRYASNPWHRAGYVLACFFSTYLWYYQRAQGSEISHALYFALLYECLLRALKRPAARRGGGWRRRGCLWDCWC